MWTSDIKTKPCEERSLRVRWVVGSLLHGGPIGLFLVPANGSVSFICTIPHTTYHSLYYINLLSYYSFQPVLNDWCNKGCGMCYPVCGMVHIKEPLLLIDKSSLCGGSGFPFSLSEWSLTISLTPYNRR